MLGNQRSRIFHLIPEILVQHPTSTMKHTTIVLLDATVDSLTVTWPEDESSKKSERYVLQYRRAAAAQDNDTAETTGNAAETSYHTLSDSLSTPMARKKNLNDPERLGFYFRVAFYVGASVEPSEWIYTHDEPFYLLTSEQAAQQMAAPTVQLSGSNSSLLISWSSDKLGMSTLPTTDTNNVDRSTVPQFQLQLRENMPGTPWTTVADSLTGTEVRKKNLSSLRGYQFRVRQWRSENDKVTVPFSPPSDPVVALGYSASLQRLFPAQLLAAKPATLPSSTLQQPAADVLGGKEFILLYASAHWCGPCRQFTPKLAQWYQSLPAYHRTIEIVFVSADRDAASFASYYATMPWAAIDYADDVRESLLSFMRVTGIPRLTVLDGKSGAIIEDNAVGKTLDVSRWRNLVRK
jgi:thiol-disulfide isomerase/thioredoxin